MMLAAQAQRFAYVLGTDDVEIQYVPRAGHFAATDNPRFVADAILNFVRRVVGRTGRRQPSTQGIWKGDERLMIYDLRALYGIKAESELPV